MGTDTINITLKVWRQKNAGDKGRFETIAVNDVDTHMSFLEMLDTAMLFVSAKVSQLALLPQGKPEAAGRALSMVAAMDALAFGNGTNHKACEAACPKEVSIVNIARLNREFIKAGVASDGR